MKTQRVLLYVVTGLVLLVVINIILSIWRPRQLQVEYGNTLPNDPAIEWVCTWWFII